MGFKYSVVCDTLKWIGHDYLENPREVFAAIKETGYDGADLGGYVDRLNPESFRAIADSFDLKLPSVLGAWAYFHAGENRDFLSHHLWRRRLMERGVRRFLTGSGENLQFRPTIEDFSYQEWLRVGPEDATATGSE